MEKPIYPLDLTKSTEELKKLIAENPDLPIIILGADWNREDIIEKIRGAERREITGPMSRGMGHGLALYPTNAKYQSDLLFVETDKARLDEFDPPEEDA